MDKIHEIRVEEVHDRENGTHFYRVYYEVNEQIKILGESSIKLINRVRDTEKLVKENFYHPAMNGKYGLKIGKAKEAQGGEARPTPNPRKNAQKAGATNAPMSHCPSQRALRCVSFLICL